MVVVVVVVVIIIIISEWPVITRSAATQRVVLAHIPVQSVHVLRAEVELFFVARPGDVLDVVGGHGLVRRRHVEPGRATDLAGVIGATPALWAIPDSTTPGARRIHRHCIPDMELGHCVTGSVGHLGHLSRPGHRVIILTRRETRTLLSGSVQTPNSDKNWQTSCPLQTCHTITGHELYTRRQSAACWKTTDRTRYD